MSKLASGEFVQYLKQFDIVCLTETFLAGCVQLYSLSGFMTFSAPAKKLTKQSRPLGGTIVLIRKSIADSFRNILVVYDNVLSRNLLGTDKDLIMQCAHLPPMGIYLD